MPASYVGIVQEVTSLRRGHVLYRLITNLILVVIILVFGGYTAYVGLHVQTIYQVLMAIAYSGVAILFVWQVAQGSVGGARSLSVPRRISFITDQELPCRW